MANESRNPARAARTFVLAFASCLALAGVGASGAAAASFKSPEFPAGFAVSSGAIAAKSSNTVYCKSLTGGNGNLQGETTGVVTFEFHGCVTGAGGTWVSCTSAGAASETIVTKPLAMDLVKLEKEEPGLALVPLNAQEAVADFSCLGIAAKWTGELIGAIEAPKVGGASHEVSVNFSSGAKTYDGRETNLLYSQSGGTTYEVNLSASNFDLTFNGGLEVTLSPEDGGGSHPVLVAAGGFPVAVSVTPLPYEGFNAVLRGSAGAPTVICKGTSKASAVTGSGEFDHQSSGHMTLALHNCKDEAFNAPCTSSGQSSGTVVTESLPTRLVYLSDGAPGVAFEANTGSGKVAEMSCLGGLVGVKVTGGVLGDIVIPGLGRSAGAELWLGMSAVKKGEGYVQEYTKTASGEALSLLETINGGGSAKSTSLEFTSGGPFLAFGSPVALME